MTAKFSSLMRQMLRRPWVRGVVSLCVLAVGYIAGFTNLTDYALHQSLRMDIARKLREVSFARLDHPLVCSGIMELADYLDPLIIETRTYDGEDAECIDEPLVEPQLTLDVHHSSRLGGSPALPQCLRLTDLRCFDDRPDLILIGSDSDHALDGDTQPSSRVSVIELRDEQDLTNASPNAREQAAVYTLRIASPDLLLDESSVVQLQGSADSADENDKDRIFAPLANRLVCQNEFPRRDHNSNEIVIYISINR